MGKKPWPENAPHIPAKTTHGKFGVRADGTGSRLVYRAHDTAQTVLTYDPHPVTPTEPYKPSAAAWHNTCEAWKKVDPAAAATWRRSAQRARLTIHMQFYRVNYRRLLHGQPAIVTADGSVYFDPWA